MSSFDAFVVKFLSEKVSEVLRAEIRASVRRRSGHIQVDYFQVYLGLVESGCITAGLRFNMSKSGRKPTLTMMRHYHHSRK